MGISKDTFDKGTKPLEQGSLAYNILEFLKNAKETDEPACNNTEILEALKITMPAKDSSDYIKNLMNYYNKVQEVRFALLSLELDSKIVSKVISTESKAEHVTYYMVK